ncbi:MAG: aminotransferase class I and II [Bacteroidetes bacterium]|nr:aminotransferase class I and II [Bacteroidota bacterium]
MSRSHPDIRTVHICRYVTPLREGGSLPAITEGDDGFLYVLKFRGAGQGVKSLIAELIGGSLAKLGGLKIPEIVFGSLDEAFGRTEPDEEIQDLLKASTGLNLGLHYLSGSSTFDAAVHKIDPLLASKIVWLDSFIKNVDRTVKNTNMLWWNKELWLIDHGASLFFHHSWNEWEKQATSPFIHIKDHVLLPQASKMEEADEYFHSIFNEVIFSDIVQSIPEKWLLVDAPFENVEAHRDAYKFYLNNRFKHSDKLVTEAKHARESII